MKTIQILSIVSVLVFLTGINAYSQDMASIDIKTSSQCEMCKDKLESGIGIEPGVKEVNLNLDTKVLTVKYNNKKTTPE
jgi:copper chaperone CopZ